MNEPKRGGDVLASVLLEALEALDDTMLRAVIARAQSLLLDRPAAPDGVDGLTVEVVDREESLVLSTYRTLGSASRRRVREGAELLRRWDATPTTPTVAATIPQGDVMRREVAAHAPALISGRQ